MISRLKRLYRPTTASFYDQAVQSGSNFLALSLLAGAYSQVEIGQFILVVSLTQIVIGVHRSLVILPFIVTQSKDHNDSTMGGWFVINLIFVAFSTAAMAATWLIVKGAGIQALDPDAIAMGTILAPCLACYEFCRRWMYQAKRYAAANVIATLLGTIFMAGVVVAVQTQRGISVAVAGYAIGGCIAVLVTLVRCWREVRNMSAAFSQWKEVGRSTGWHLMSFIAHSSYTSAMPLVIAFVGNQQMVAIFGSTRALVTPFFTAATALDSVEKPKASRAYAAGGLPALQTSAIRTGIILLAIAAPGLLCILLFGPWLLQVAFGPTYRQYYSVLAIWCLSATLTLVNQPMESCMIVLQKTRELFLSKIAASLIGILFVCLLVPHLNAMGAVIAGGSAILIALLMNLNTIRAVGISQKSQTP